MFVRNSALCCSVAELGPRGFCETEPIGWEVGLLREKTILGLDKWDESDKKCFGRALEACFGCAIAAHFRCGRLALFVRKQALSCSVADLGIAFCETEPIGREFGFDRAKTVRVHRWELALFVQNPSLNRSFAEMGIVIPARSGSHRARLGLLEILWMLLIAG